ncbi:OadG family protein [Rubellicoccus peritrichatus]|uniref:OadG family protein n=1 Tax=Rubellicoccus peritrichatus TaxID=3080537 RepID=A0AAQ3L6H1_9BACT|nr:OadG family protein [Puniceicoccus sp. CR14]WOO40205.1 OadG family protein [Puniceicoccus sp. CR14]
MSYIGNIASVDTVTNTESPELFGIVVIGFLFVMVVLALIAAVTAIFGAFFVKKAAADLVKVSRNLEKTAESTKSIAETNSQMIAARDDKETAEVEDPEVAAVISAAVYTMLKDRPHRIVSIRPGGPGWAQEGRRQIFSSHRVR